MDSEVLQKATEANDTLAARADERLAHAYEQISRADEQLARLTEQLARMEYDAARQPSAIPRRRSSRGRPALRGLVGLLGAACIVGIALASQSSYGEAARPVIARWVTPYIGSISWLAQVKPDASAQPGPSGVQLASVEAASPKVAPSAQTSPQDAAAPTGAELVQLMQTMARDLATVQQGVEQLRAGQEQLAGDNAKIAEQFKASQEQMASLVAKVSEQEQRTARTAAPPTRPAADPARRPLPASVQARGQPMQLQPAAR